MLEWGKDSFKFKIVFVPIVDIDRWYLCIVCLPVFMYSENDILSSLLIFDSLVQHPNKNSFVCNLITR